MNMEIALGDDLSKHKNPKHRRKLKECPKCGILNHISQKKCVDCSNYFYITQNKSKKSIRKYKKLVEDWKDLKLGCEVYIQTNDYYQNSEGDIIDISYNQEFIIKDIKPSGLVVYSAKLGWAFIDMITNGKRKETLITRTIPKIFMN